MQRLVFEWSGIACALIALLGLVFWLFSTFSDVVDFELSFGSGDNGFEVVASDGNLLLCESIANLEVLDLVERGVAMDPPMTTHVAWAVPGLRFRHARFGKTSPALAWSIWAANVSCVLPALLAGLVAVLSFRRLRAIQRRASAAKAAQSDEATGRINCMTTW